MPKRILPSFKIPVLFRMIKNNRKSIKFPKMENFSTRQNLYTSNYQQNKKQKQKTTYLVNNFLSFYFVN